MNTTPQRQPNSCQVPLGGVLAVLIAGLLVAACGSGTTTLVGPTTQKCQISVNGFTGSFGPSGGSGSVNVEAARECTWSASTTAPWISFPSTRQGQGSGTLSFAVQPNQVPQGRTGALEVNGERLSVSQEPAPCRFELSAGGNRVPSAGGAGSVNVVSMEGCAWSASSPVPWVTLTAGSSGGGSGTVRYAVAPNPGLERSAVLTIAGQPYTIEQDAPPVAPPAPTPPSPSPTPPAPPTCSYSVTPGSLSFPAGGGEAAVSVGTQGGNCPWTAAVSAAWLRVTPGSGSGGGTITVVAEANPDASQRTATITIGGQTVSVTQAAAAAAATPVVLSGEIRSPDGECPDRRFTVSGTRVTASASTQYVNSSCGDLKNNRTVFVEGLRGADGTVAATRIRVDDDD